MAANIWQEEVIVKSSETDFQKRLKPSSLFEIMQDAASNHASQLGFGYEDLQKKEIAWVLSRKKVRFFDYPEMGEKILVRTWPKGIQQKVFFMRDHKITGADGRLLATSTSAYVVISARARRMVLPNLLDFPIPDNGGLNALDENLDKLPTLENLTECYQLKANYSAIDIMGHVNNARYIEWISDCFSMEEHIQHRPAWLQINYLSEVKPGELVTMMRGERPQDPGGWYVTAVNQSSGSRAFEAELHW